MHLTNTNKNTNIYCILYNMCVYLYKCAQTHAHTYLFNSLIQLNMMTGFWNDLQAEDKALFCGSLLFPSSLSSSHRMNLKRLVTLLWVCEGNELHLVTDWTGHLKPGLLALKGPAITELISERGVKGWLLFWKLKGRPDGNMSALLLSISLQGAYQVSISRAREKGQTVAVNPYSATGKL